MRTFIAIELPKEIKQSLANLQSDLKTTNADVKWVNPDNIHLTLKFLGEISDDKIDKITKIMQDISLSKPSFSIHLSNLGAFPSIRSPRVIWIGIEKGISETKELAKELEKKIEKIGIHRDNKGFSCHITLARVRSNLNRGLLAKKLEDLIGRPLNIPHPEIPVTKITLFKSTLTPKGPIYESIYLTNLVGW